MSLGISLFILFVNINGNAINLLKTNLKTVVKVFKYISFNQNNMKYE